MKRTIVIWPVLGLALLLAGCGRTAPAEDPSAHLYRTVVHYTGEDESEAQYLEIAGRSQKLVGRLEEKAGAFVMSAYNYQKMEEGVPLYEMNSLSYPKEIAPNGQCVTVSKNYFDYNPIETADGSRLAERLVKDDRTLNVLVPEKYREMEEQIIEAHRADFYFQKVTAENCYNEMAGSSERLDMELEDLKVNLIYIKDGQNFGTFRDDCLSVADPVAQVYTGNIHCNYAHSFLSQWLYVPSAEEDEAAAYAEIAPYIEECGAEESVQRLEKATQ